MVWYKNRETVYLNVYSLAVGFSSSAFTILFEGLELVKEAFFLLSVMTQVGFNKTQIDSIES